MDQFTQADIMLIEKEITRKSYADIAFLLDCTKEDIAVFVRDHLEPKGIIPHESSLQQKRESRLPAARKPRAKKEKPKERKIESRIISRSDVEYQQKVKRERADRRQFKTKEIDLGKMQEVRIDRKTCIYIKPGLCAETARTNYIKKLKEHKSRMMQNEL